MGHIGILVGRWSDASVGVGIHRPGFFPVVSLTYSSGPRVCYYSTRTPTTVPITCAASFWHSGSAVIVITRLG